MKHKLLNFVVKNNFSYGLFSYFYFRKYRFKKIEPIQIDARWGNLTANYRMNIPIKHLLALMNSGSGYLPIPVAESPHYKMISKYSETGEIKAKEYTEYLKTYNIENNGTTKFINLYESIKKDPNNVFICIKKEADSFITNKFKIIDGLHRASIATTLNLNSVDCYVVEKIN